MNCDNTYLTINLDAIHANFDAIQEKAGVPVMAVVKADAYGHGALQIAHELEEKCAFFGVSSILEAQELHRGGIHKPILILCQAPASAYKLAIRDEIRLTISCYEDALALSQTAQMLKKDVYIHIAVDTGMSRIGFPATEEAADLCAKISKLPGLQVEGLFSHFATADCKDLSRSHAQARLFDRFYDLLCQRGVKIPIRHLDNSAGIMNFGTHYEMVRAGIITYGMYPSDEIDRSTLALRPALQWFSRVSHVKLLPAGQEISYGGTYVTTAPTRVATITTGYADGYRRSLSGQFYVLIRGKKAPILGRVCMDQLMVDVTDIPDCIPGDTVTLIGTDADARISVEEISAAAGSFPYEFVCGIGRRVPRKYYKNGQLVGTVQYLLDYLLNP